jgi:dipeptidyl-peptidase-4
VVSKLDINTGKTQLLSNAEGNNSAAFSKTFNYFINTSSTAKVPTSYVLKDANGKDVKELQNNNDLLGKLKADNFLNKEFISIPNTAGDQMNAWVIKPKDFNPAKKYPVFMFQYSGPGSQQVSNSWDGGNGIWFDMLAQKGYIVVCVDGRGTGFRGTKYKKVTYKILVNTK